MLYKSYKLSHQNLLKFVKERLEFLNKNGAFEANTQTVETFILSVHEKLENLKIVRTFYIELFKRISSEQFDRLLTTKIGLCIKKTHLNKDISLFTNPFNFSNELGGNSVKQLIINNTLDKLAQYKAEGKMGEYRLFIYFLTTTIPEKHSLLTAMNTYIELFEQKKNHNAPKKQVI